MKLYTEEVEVKSEGDFHGGEAKIKAGGHAFAVLSKGLYSDPHLAIVRELCCNAWDSHIAAGNTGKKFDLCLPNALAPIFKVRDYGTGLSTDAAVLKMYDYFDSTKQQSDTMTGCFGLGAKSPYAYTKKFTTLNFYNGKVTHFISFLNERGIPDTIKMAEKETDEPNGVEVSFSVEPEDFYHFEYAAKRALVPFKVKPNVQGVHNLDRIFTEDRRVATLAGDDWRFYGDGQCLAFMGNVSYPLGTTVRKGMSINAQKLLGFNIEIDFPMGAFEITPSRESVQWTEYSVNNINDKLEAIYDVVLEHVNQKIQSAPNYWTACIKAKELQQTSFRSFITSLSYGGRAIAGEVPIHDEFKLTALTASTPRRDSHGKTRAPNSVERYVCGGTIRPNDCEFYFGDYKGATNKIENYVRYDLSRNDKVYFLQFTTMVDKKNEKLGIIEKVPVITYDQSKIKDFCAGLGIDLADVKMVSSIPDKARDGSTRKGRLVGSQAHAFTYNFSAYGHQNDLYWNEYDCDLAAVKEGVYVEIGLWQFRNSRLGEKPREFKEFADKLSNLGIKFPEDRLVGVKTADLDKFKKASNWKTLDVWVAEQVKALWQDKDFQFAYQVLTRERHRHYSYGVDDNSSRENFFREIVGLPQAGFAKCPEWQKLITQLKEVLKHSAKAHRFNHCVIAGIDPAFDKEIEATSKEAEALVDTSVTRYPLLTALYQRYSGGNLYRNLPSIIHYVQLIDNEVKSCPSSSATI